MGMGCLYRGLKKYFLEGILTIDGKNFQRYTFYKQGRSEDGNGERQRQMALVAWRAPLGFGRPPTLRAPST